MQMATTAGLVSAPIARRRSSCVVVHDVESGRRDASRTHPLIEALVDEWANVDSRKAAEILSSRDVHVTNQGDKELQLPKIHSLSDRVAECLTAESKKQSSTSVLA